MGQKVDIAYLESKPADACETSFFSLRGEPCFWARSVAVQMGVWWKVRDAPGFSVPMLMKVERKIAHLMRRKHGGRRARMRGRLRIAHDFAFLAAAVNLARLAKLHTTAASA